MLSIILIVSMLLSCRGERWDDDLTLPNQHYSGNELKTDGYYYRSASSNYEVIFLYRNGVVLHGTYVPFAEITQQEQEYANGTFYSFIKEDKTSWGRFVVEGNVIKREFWQPGNGNPLDAYTHSGTIINDSTFQITQAWRSCKPKKKNSLDEIWHFKKFGPKPDSSNSFTN